MSRKYWWLDWHKLIFFGSVSIVTGSVISLVTSAVHAGWGWGFIGLFEMIGYFILAMD